MINIRLLKTVNKTALRLTFVIPQYNKRYVIYLQFTTNIACYQNSNKPLCRVIWYIYNHIFILTICKGKVMRIKQAIIDFNSSLFKWCNRKLSNLSVAQMRCMNHAQIHISAIARSMLINEYRPWIEYKRWKKEESTVLKFSSLNEHTRYFVTYQCTSCHYPSDLVVSCANSMCLYLI